MSEDNPIITLKEACERVFDGAIKPSTLKAEALRGRLEIALIGKRYFTTLRSARELFDKCRVDQEGRASTWTRNGKPGPSETEQVSAALARANNSVARLKRPSKNTLPGNTARNHPLPR